MASDFHTVTKGDLLLPISRIITKNGKPLDLSSYTVKWKMVNDAGTSITAATAVGITKQPTSTFTVSATTDLLTSVGHVVQEDDEIVVSTTTTLPGGLAASTRYFAKEVSPNAFKLSSVPGGQAINITDTGTGTHSFYIVGHVVYQMTSTEVGTAGVYWGWFSALDGTPNSQHWPNNGRGLRIDVVEAA